MMSRCSRPRRFRYPDPCLVRRLYDSSKPRLVHIDLAGVEYCDIAALRLMVRLTWSDDLNGDHGGARRVVLHGATVDEDLPDLERAVQALTRSMDKEDPDTRTGTT
jgi:hypothetical protein